MSLQFRPLLRLHSPASPDGAPYALAIRIDGKVTAIIAAAAADCLLPPLLLLRLLSWLLLLRILLQLMLLQLTLLPIWASWLHLPRMPVDTGVAVPELLIN